VTKDRPFGTAYLLGYLAQWRSVPVVGFLGSVPINHADIVWQHLTAINRDATKIEALSSTLQL
jgi:hypothetical protein